VCEYWGGCTKKAQSSLSCTNVWSSRPCGNGVRSLSADLAYAAIDIARLESESVIVPMPSAPLLTQDTRTHTSTTRSQTTTTDDGNLPVLRTSLSSLLPPHRGVLMAQHWMQTLLHVRCSSSFSSPAIHGSLCHISHTIDAETRTRLEIGEFGKRTKCSCPKQSDMSM